MAIRWLGSAVSLPQIQSYTFAGTWEATDLIRVTIGQKVYDFVAGSTTIATIVEDLVEAWEDLDADLFPEFAEITPSQSSTTLVLTGPDDGTPFTCTLTPLETGGGAADAQTIEGAGVATTGTATQTPSGKNWWSVARNWSGNAVPVTGVNEVQTITVDATGGTFTVTFVGQTTAGQAFDVSAANLQTALQGLSSIGSGNITVSGGPGAAGGGTPYTLTFVGTLGYQNVAAVTTNAASLTGGAGTAAVATTVAGSSGDDVIIDIPVPIKYGLAQSAVVLNSLTILGTFEGSDATIGLPEVNADGAEYWEYRDTYLAISVSQNGTIEIGKGVGAGPDMVKLNTGSINANITVYATGTNPEDDLEAFLWKGTGTASYIVAMGNCSVGVAVMASGSESATLPTLTLHGGATVRCGSGTTLTTIVIYAGVLEVNSAIGTSLTLHDGQVTINGTGAVAQLTMHSGYCVYNTTGTLGGNTLLAGNAVLDFNQNPKVKTVTNVIDAYGDDRQILDDNQVVSNLRVDLNEGVHAGNLGLGRNIRLSRGAPA